MSQSLRVACLLSEKKRRHLDFPALVDAAASQGLELVAIDLDKDIKADFNVVLHKLTDTIARARDGNEQAKRQLERLQEYRSRQPNVIMIDNLSSVAVLLDRGLTYSLATQMEMYPGEIPLLTPTFSVVKDKEAALALLSKPSSSADHQLHFPLLSKSILAHGSTKAHHMAILFDTDGLADVEYPCVLQQFVNHNAVVFKLFVLGNDISVVKRPSIRNLDPSTHTETIFFDSHKVSKADSDSHLNLAGAHYSSGTQLELAQLRPSVQRLRHKLGLDLFGIDVVVCCESNRHYIVDVNYFPGYNGVEGFHDSLIALLHSRAKRSQS
eukprot:TRINITY_DN10048_c0_g2_i1.p2 TRINITY_DN10048_c0_g2~~TRINITY_DN10048_c0_g2_i1.p2  ORF type:complete len:325 (+),score=82.89 TRINITY_DN10048_c0_g2_i1:253-1227(+)